MQKNFFHPPQTAFFAKRTHLLMRIAINCRFLIKNKLEGIGRFTYEIAKRLVRNHPEHEFIFLFDRKYSKDFIFGENVTPKVIPPPARHPLLWKLWFEQAVPKVLRQVEADLFFSPDGFLSLRSTTPTVMVVHDLAFEHFPESIPGNVARFYKKNAPKYAVKADHLITVSEYTKQDLIKQYNLPSEKISVVHNGVSAVFTPFSEEERHEVKQQYSDGEDYFLFISALQPRKNVLRLLAAFEQFKERTGASTKLLIVGGHTWQKKEIEQQLRQMQYSGAVVFLGHRTQQELKQILPAALALTYVSLFEGFGIPIVEAMQAGVPVVCSNTSSMPEVAGEAAILIDPYDVEDIANALQKIHHDPTLRQQLINKGLEQHRKFDWDRSAEKVWDVLVSRAGRK